MASPPALLPPPLLLLLLLPAAPGTRGHRAPPEPGPGQPTPARTPAVLRDHWPESHTSAHTTNLPLGQDQRNFTATVSKERMLVHTLRKSLVSADAPEAFTLQIGSVDAGGRAESSRSFRGHHSHQGSDRAAALTPQSSWASAGTEVLTGLPTLRSPTTRQADSTRAAHTILSSVRPAVQSFTVSLGPPNERYPEEASDLTMTYAAAPSSPSEAEPGRNDATLHDPGEGKFPKDEFARPSSRVLVGIRPDDSPASSEHPFAHNYSAETRSLLMQTATMSRSVRPDLEGQSTAQWLWEHKTFTDVTGNSTSPPGAVSASDFTHFPESGSRGLVLQESHRSKSLSGTLFSSSSESQETSALRGERSTTEYSPELSSDVEEQTFEGTPGDRAHDPQTAATFTGNGERTLRSLTNRSATTSQDGGRSAATPQHTESAPLHGNATARLGSRAPGVTVVGRDPVSGFSFDPKTDDHTYISSAFTKGERVLLSITETSSASEPRSSATSSVHESMGGRSHHPPSSGVETEGSKATQPDGARVRPSTTPLVPRTARLPSSTPVVNMSNTLVLLGAEAASVGDPSSRPSSGPPLPLPSVSQSHQPFLHTLPSARTSAPPLHPTSGAPTLLSSSAPPSPVAPSTLTPASPAFFRTTTVLPRTSVQMSTTVSPEDTLPSHQTTDPENPSQADQEKVITASVVPSPGSLPTEATNTGTVNSTSSIPGSMPLTEASTEPALPATSTILAQTFPPVIATTLQTSPPLTSTSSPAASSAAPAAGHTTVHTEAEKLLPTSPGIFMPPVTTEGPITTQRSSKRTEATLGPLSPTSAPTPTKEATPEPGITGVYSATPHFLTLSPASKTSEFSTAEVLTPKSPQTTQPPMAPSPASANSCATNPCLHGGRCIEEPPGLGHRCVCSPSWQGADCSVDVNECLSNPCPALAVCNNTQGSFICKCPVGYQLDKGMCNLVRTFLAELKVKKILLNATVELREVENEVTKMLNACFSPIPGYTQSTVHASRESSTMTMSLQTTFALASNVTLFDLADRVQHCANSCRASAELCHLLASQRRVFRGSLCRRKTPECDRETSLCTDLDGIARCQCKLGYFQFNKMDHSCRACEDGYRLENETCLSCPFGLGGLNCGNPYQLITVVIAAAGGGLLLILGIALIVTCCRKNKNDISKLIFKSGDFQMSPYAEYPKNPRSQEWGREAIEMHENGSTKNLLQMTDVYYSPTSVRNPELERNGLYPAYTGLPGSRHSCIFPGQYNPSFISDESRRRDYF